MDDPAAALARRAESFEPARRIVPASFAFRPDAAAASRSRPARALPR